MLTALPADTNSFLDEKKRLQSAGRLKWFHWVIIGASLVITLVAWQYARSQNNIQIQNRFDREVTQVVELISERMLKYEDALWGGVAAINSQSQGMTLTEWEDYSRSLNIEVKYPGINGIGVIDYIPEAKLETYLEIQREERPDFRVFPEHEENEYWPITYIEPVASNAAAVGLDIAHESNRYAAARKARDTGRAQITGPIVLVQDTRQTPGFLFYAPRYSPQTLDNMDSRRNGFEGLVYAPFIFERLMRGTLGGENRLVGLKITDADTVLFDETKLGYSSDDAAASFKKEVIVNHYGREWQFKFWSKPAFDAVTVNNKPWIILLSGLLIEALLIGLFYSLARSNRRAINFAEKMANAQQANAVRLNNIVENAVDGLMTVNADGLIESYNKACGDIFGYPVEAIIGKPMKTLMPDLKDDYRELFVDNVESSDTGDKKIIGSGREIEGRRQDGSLIMLEVSISQINDQGRVLYNAIVRDISRRKKAEQALNHAMEDLILSNEELEKFAYIASHDLKSPLRAIDNLSKWLEEDLDAVMDDENRDRVHKLRGRVLRMENLLDDLLEYSRAGNNIKDAKILLAGQLVRDVCELLNIPPEFDVVIDPSLDDFHVSRMPLEQIFHNLINNAIKHHDKPSGTIHISAESVGDNHKFIVADDGPGIAPDYHNKIFEMFQTLKPRDEVEGSGMGLALVRKIVYHHGGRVAIESDTGQGSKFIITWPKTPKLRSQPSRNRKARYAN